MQNGLLSWFMGILIAVALGSSGLLWANLNSAVNALAAVELARAERIATLEAHYQTIRIDLAEIKVGLRRLEERRRSEER